MMSGRKGKVPVAEAMRLIGKRFDDQAMADRDFPLGVAGRALEKTGETAYAIGGIAEILYANSLGRDSDQEILSGNQECALMTAIILLANNLNDSVVNTADRISEQMKTREGGHDGKH